jgi:hypothetical protein
VDASQTTNRKDDRPIGQSPPAPAPALTLTREQANALVKELAKQILERDAEDDNAYVEELVKGIRDPIDVAWMMAHSKEYDKKFLQNCSHEDAIRTLYAKLFRREPTDQEVEDNAAFYRFLGWRETVYKVLTEDKGKTYAGQIGRNIGWKPLGEVRHALDGRRWKTFAGQVYEWLTGKKDSKGPSGHSQVPPRDRGEMTPPACRGRTRPQPLPDRIVFGGRGAAGLASRHLQ